jgi:hypothetical protein
VETAKLCETSAIHPVYTYMVVSLQNEDPLQNGTAIKTGNIDVTHFSRLSCGLTYVGYTDVIFPMQTFILLRTDKNKQLSSS